MLTSMLLSAVLMGAVSALDRKLMMVKNPGAAVGFDPALAEVFKAGTPCDGRDWTFRLTGPFAPVEMEIRPGVDRSQYSADQIDAAGEILYMAYPPHQQGDLVCLSGAEVQNNKTIFIGGQVFLHNGEKCLNPPTKVDGSPCCKMHFWHPDGEGYYRSVCTATQDIGADGLWFFETINPGDECSVKWGGDCAEHVHYALKCDACDETNADYAPIMKFGESPQFFSPNKFYLHSASQEEPGAAAMHVANSNATVPDGTDTFQYTMVYGIWERDKPGFELPASGDDGDDDDDDDDDDAGDDDDDDDDDDAA